MALTLADKITLARLVLAPAVACSYLLLPIEHGWCFWAAGWLCAIAEYSDLVDGRIARARGEVSDFGKLADPFCDVFYRLTVFMAYLLPAGGVGYLVAVPGVEALDGAIQRGHPLGPPASWCSWSATSARPRAVRSPSSAPAWCPGCRSC